MKCLTNLKVSRDTNTFQQNHIVPFFFDEGLNFDNRVSFYLARYMIGLSQI